jgi:uncharacterized protein (TIGR02145 family)
MKTLILLFSFILLFTVSCEDSPSKVESVFFDTVKIGDQVWMKRDLDVSKYRNGDEIKQVQDRNEWVNADYGAWCYYNNSIQIFNDIRKGRLYNLEAVLDERGLAPKGWRIANDEDWKKLERYLGMDSTEIDKIGFSRAHGDGIAYRLLYTTFLPFDYDRTKSTRFDAMLAGSRSLSGVYGGNDGSSTWWSLNGIDSSLGLTRSIIIDSDYMIRQYHSRKSGFTVRCIRE